ncbi:MAG: ATP-binding protein [Syntrophales bacterium]
MLSSIKARIVLFYLVILLITLSIMGTILYFSLSKIVYASVDSSLLSRAKALATLIHEDKQETEFEFSDDVMWEYSSPKANNFFQIRRLDGITLEKSSSLGELELPYDPKAGPATFQTGLLKGNPIRQINFPIRKEGEGNGRGIVIQCAEAIRDKIILLHTFGLVLTVSVFFIMAISAAGGFFIAKKALRPIQDISGAIDRISETNLSERIEDEHIPDELKNIAASFNRTFGCLERAFSRQKQFVADASHELKTPLAVIISQGEITLRKVRDPSEYRIALTAILEAAGMMSLIIEKLLALARFSSDKFTLQMEDVHLNGIIDQSLKLLRSLADEKGIVFNMPTGKEYTVHGDREALLETFVNILANAIKYNVPDGRIGIGIRKEREYIVTEITDTGIGIPEEDLEKVFDRFYRADKSRSKESGGIGLGLSISSDIIRLHGGRIGIRSKTGEGTVVSVYLAGAESE